jgi:hypothetical protein
MSEMPTIEVRKSAKELAQQVAGLDMQNLTIFLSN